MNYIIDPSVFYWMNVLGILQTVFAVFGAFGLCAGISFMGYGKMSEPEAYDKEYDVKKASYISIVDEEKLKRFKSIIKTGVIIAAISLLFVIASIFIPGKATSIEMLVARTATYDNLNIGIDGVKELIDYIVTAIKSVV